MIRILLIIASFGSFSSYGQTILRKWKQVDDQTGKARSIIQLYEKEGKVAGKILEIMLQPGEDPHPTCTACDPTDHRFKKPILGMEILANLEQDGSDFVNGTILDPENGKVYRCKLWLDGRNLKLRGYWGVFYRTQTWLPAE